MSETVTTTAHRLAGLRTERANLKARIPAGTDLRPELRTRLVAVEAEIAKLEPPAPVAHLKTGELGPGMIVRNYGMRLLIDGEIHLSASHPQDNGGCHYTRALVLNPDEVKAAGFVPFHWLFEHRWVEGRGWVQGDELGEAPRWSIQGNDLATWAVEHPPAGA